MTGEISERVAGAPNRTRGALRHQTDLALTHEPSLALDGEPAFASEGDDEDVLCPRSRRAGISSISIMPPSGIGTLIDRQKNGPVRTGGEAMYVVVRRDTGAAQLFDALEQHKGEVEQLLRGVPGFSAYYLFRSGGEGASVTVCDDRAGTQESTRLAAEWVRQNVPGLTAGPPTVTEGEAFLQFSR